MIFRTSNTSVARPWLGFLWILQFTMNWADGPSLTRRADFGGGHEVQHSPPPPPPIWLAVLAIGLAYVLVR